MSVIGSDNPSTSSAFLFTPITYDEVMLTYSGDNIATVVYKYLTATVRTLTMSYTGDNLTEVVAT